MNVEETAKRALDVTVSALALVLLAPLLVLCAIWIKWESGGPVFFRQARLGLNARTFHIFKFRTMRVNAPILRNPDGSTFAPADDLRVTRAGHFLRKTSLDELPQLLDVFVGKMSLVGPRPEPSDLLDKYREIDLVRFDVRPGITGLAQVSGRNSLDWESRRNLDIDYVRTRTLWLDIWIIARTFTVVLSGSGTHMQPSAAENPEGQDEKAK